MLSSKSLSLGFSPAIADTSEKADNGRGGVSCQKEENTRRSSKREAVALANQPGVTRVQIGRELDINPNMITRWQRELSANGSKAFLGQGVARDEELASLKRENRQLRKERDFLREAATFFASDQKRSTR
jgi:transposase